VTEAGESMVVADGRMENLLARLLDGEELGTLFVPGVRRMSARSRWIGSARPSGTIVIDDGAVKAIIEKNRSLLPAGVTRVEGAFEAADVVAIAATDGRVIARGLSNYSSADVGRILGKKSEEIRNLLGDVAYEELIHRDNLVRE